MAKKSKGALRLYKSYNFVDKDPIIDRMRTITKGVKYTDIAEKSGVSVTTLYSWFEGQTRRPQFATVAAVVRALGYRITIVKPTPRATEATLVPKEKEPA